MTLVPTTTTELATLADQINEGHRRVVESAETTLALAIEVGHFLLAAYELAPDGPWGQWVEHNCVFSYNTARHYQRIAHYEQALTGDEPSVYAAMTTLRGLPYIHAHTPANAHPPELKAKARAMLKEGQTVTRVAEELGLGASTVQNWRLTDQERRDELLRSYHRQQAARKALKEQERREAVMAAAGPSIAELYSRVRLALEVVDAAILEPTDDRNSARFLRETRSFLYSAERRIVKALGVE